MTVVANSRDLITVEWEGLEGDGRGRLRISPLPNRLSAEHLQDLGKALYEAAECPRMPYKQFILLFL